MHPKFTCNLTLRFLISYCLKCKLKLELRRKLFSCHRHFLLHVLGYSGLFLLLNMVSSFWGALYTS